MKKGIACLLAGAMMVSLCAAPAGAVYQDSQDHWAKEAIEIWSGHGVIQGDNGSFRPNDSITRGEMAAILVRLLGLTETEGASFMDVAPDAWYADAIAKCAAAGIMKGDNGMARPNDPISRQEAMVMLGRALGVQEASRSEKTYLDGELVADWAAGYVNALTNRGIVSGVGENQLAPLSEINRASVVTILQNAVTNYVNQPGQTVNVSGDGITVVAASNVTVTGATTGDVLIAAGAVAGSVTLDGLKAEGSVVVTAPGASVTITGSANVSGLVVDSSADRAQVIVETDGKAGGVTVSAPTATVIIKGEVTSVETTEDAAGTRITVTETGAVDKVAVSSDHTSVAVEGDVSKVTTEATGTDISGSGKVESVTAQAGASDVTVSTPRTEITVSASAGSSVTVNKAEVKPGESGTTNNRGDNVVIDKDDSSTSKPSSSSGGNEPDDVYYTVTFMDGENVMETQRIREGRTVSQPTDPVKEGYTFGGWYAGETVYNFETPVTGTLTLTAKWLANPQTITLVEGAHSTSYKTEYGSKLDEKTLNALIESGRPGEYVTGWYSDAEYQIPYAFDTVVTGDLTLYYGMGAYAYTVTYSISDVTNLSGAAAYNSAIDLPECTEEGYTWTWYTDADFTQTAAGMTMPAHDVTLYGQWSHDASGLKGHGTENDPFLIGTAEDFAGISELSSAMIAGTSYCFEQTDNIAIANVYMPLNGTYNGGGNSISLTERGKGAYSIFGDTYGETCIENLVIEERANGVLTLINYDGSTSLTVKNISIESSDNEMLEVNTNNFGFIIANPIYEPWGPESAQTLLFENITNEVDVTNNGTCIGMIIGSGPCFEYETSSVTYRNCVNNGTIIGTTFAGLLYGNPSYLDTIVNSEQFTVDHCANDGTIKVTSKDGVAGMCPKAGTNDVLKAKGYDTNQGTGSYIVGSVIADNAFCAYSTENGFVLVTDGSNNYTYQLVFNIYNVNWNEGTVSNGIKVMVPVEVDEDGSGATSFTAKNCHAYSVDKAIENSVITEEEAKELTVNASGAYSPCVISKDGNIYVILLNVPDGYVDSGLSLYAYAYDTDGTLVGIKGF